MALSAARRNSASVSTSLPFVRRRMLPYSFPARFETPIQPKKRQTKLSGTYTVPLRMIADTE